MKTKKDKQKIVQDLAEKFKKARGYLIVNLLNLNSQSQTKLRNLLKENDALFQVVKKNLIYKAYPDFPFNDEELKTPFAFIWNLSSELKIFPVLKKIKTEGLQIEILKGYLWDKILSSKEIEEIINLPSKEELISKFIFSLKRQIYQFNFALSSPLNKLILILSNIKK